jgi:hypothetical protein
MKAVYKVTLNDIISHTLSCIYIEYSCTVTRSEVCVNFPAQKRNVYLTECIAENSKLPSNWYANIHAGRPPLLQETQRTGICWVTLAYTAVRRNVSAVC